MELPLLLTLLGEGEDTVLPSGYKNNDAGKALGSLHQERRGVQLTGAHMDPDPGCYCLAAKST